jgi:hypothetical protein
LSREKIMESKYCTYLTIYYGSLLPRRYVGSSSVDKVNNGYNGSVKSKKWAKIFIDEQKRNKHLFKTRILSFHETRKDAIEYELELHKKYNVTLDETFMNQSLAAPNGFFGRNVSGENNPMFGKIHPNRGKQINSGHHGEKNPMYGLRGAAHPAYGYKRSEDTNKKTAESLRGIPKTDEHKLNLKKSRQRDSYKQKVYRPIYVCGVFYESIKSAIENSGKTHYFIHTKLKQQENKEVYYADGN